MGLGWDDVRLPNPVRPGDELDLEMTVLRCAAVGRQRADPGLKCSIRSKTAAPPNLKTAATLGLTLPNDILATANVVIE